MDAKELAARHAARLAAIHAQRDAQGICRPGIINRKFCATHNTYLVVCR